MKLKKIKKRKSLLVTGASGFLGWNICSVAHKSWDVFGVAFSNPIEIPGINIKVVDLTDFYNLKQLLIDVAPYAVIHAAAAANTNYCQINQTESHKINVDTSINIAGLCMERNIPLVFVSSDMVFDGLNAPYKEKDPVCPVNVYGEQKVLAEKEMVKRCPGMTICRTSIMFGHHPDRTKNWFQKNIESMRMHQDVQLFVDEYRTFLSVRKAVSGLLLAIDNISGILHLSGDERISRYDFARLVTGVFHINNARLIPCDLTDVPVKAPRAKDLSLNNSKAKAFGFNPSSIEKELEALSSIIARSSRPPE